MEKSKIIFLVQYPSQKSQSRDQSFKGLLMKKKFDTMCLHVTSISVFFIFLNAQIIAMIPPISQEEAIAQLNNLSSQIIKVYEMEGGYQWYSAELTNCRLLIISKYLRGFGPRDPAYNGALEINRFSPNPKLIDLSTEKSAECFEILSAMYQKQENNKKRI